MKGDKVIARAFGAKPLVRRVWGATGDVVYICTDERYELLKKGVNLSPIGFPKRDIFEYDELALSKLEGDVTYWNRLKMWNGDLADPID